MSDNGSYGKLYITISGIIGAGKSTLAEELAKVMKLPVYSEPVQNNPYLAKFYAEPDKYGFVMQIWLLNQRFRQQQQITWQNQGGIEDRGFYEDQIFAKVLREEGHMQKHEFDVYMELVGNMTNFTKRPNLIVYLDVKPKEALERITKRGRECEKSMPLDYLQKLYQEYENFISEISKKIPVIRVDYSKFRTAEEMATMIYKEYQNMGMIREVSWNNTE